MLRRLALILAVLLIASIVLPLQSVGDFSAAAMEVSISRPNIVVIMADDLDNRSLNKLVKAGLAPNIKGKIIDKAVTFSNSFSTFPLCCPSRATFLTGQYPHNHGVMHNLLPEGGVAKFEDSSSIAIWLNNSGYHTGYVGKYLNQYGVDTPGTYIPPGWNDWQATVGPSTYQMYSYIINDNGNLVTYGKNEKHYQTDILALRAIQYIQEREPQDATPFFLYINPLAPHTDRTTQYCAMNYGLMQTVKPPARYIGTTDHIPLPKPPSFNESDVSDKPVASIAAPLSAAQIACLDDHFHNRLESMRAVDDLVRKVVNNLNNYGELDNTVVVFTSDNGYLLGEHRFREKTRLYEESIRVPLYIRIPGIQTQTIGKLVTNNDLAPTFLELAGAQAGLPIDGRSLIPLIEDPDLEWRKAFLIDTRGYSAIRTEDYIYARHHLTNETEMYDLVKDPYELSSVSGEFPWIEKIPALEEWRKSLLGCAAETCQTLENQIPP
jgi:arylsulfatase A-like enzyme